MPLPCSPVSHSEESQQSQTDDESSSDDSLTTPRPGPADPAKRTVEGLSRPLEVSGLANTDGASPQSRTWEGKQSGGANVDGQPKSARQPSISFSPQTASPRAMVDSSYFAPSSLTSRGSPNEPSPRGTSRRAQSLDEVAESSADESTAIIRTPRTSATRVNNYGATSASGDGAVEEPRLRRHSSGVKTRSGNGATTREESNEHEGNERGESWFRRLAEKYGSVELENKGSVARDHLALERTFLAWLRTSLSFASIGIAITQLFRLNTTVQSPGSDNGGVPSHARSRLRSVGKPLGATFLGISILILILGFHRYFESQHYVIRGKFPASRGTILVVSAVAASLIIASLVVVLAVAPDAFET